MPSYQGVLSPAETSALLEYIRSLRDVAPVPLAPPPTGPIAVPAPARASARSLAW
jgi:hypothetical protein